MKNTIETTSEFRKILLKTREDLLLSENYSSSHEETMESEAMLFFINLILSKPDSEDLYYLYKSIKDKL